ncbi:hypothetical protein ON058_08555 [Demequina sp. B12]|uniref:hypothetical protein n=1 Tax=Demequina sp. B12 TaxID=2992757 RepID=UPI00237BBD2D|nr:hypothetical protein [Demequina sp. B12]MDE0573466.1 hypothetical protein [Demequina sp. B12]
MAVPDPASLTDGTWTQASTLIPLIAIAVLAVVAVLAVIAYFSMAVNVARMRHDLKALVEIVEAEEKARIESQPEDPFDALVPPPRKAQTAASR